jgi:hypothetical protein
LTRTSHIAATALVLCCLSFSPAAAQVPWAPGFIEVKGNLFPQQTPNDETQAVGDALWRQEALFRPASWLQLAAGMDLRLNTHDQVNDRWKVDWEDRGVRPSPLTLRRLAATISAGPLTFDLGKQLIRWARADVLNPNDRFAPRDFMNVIDAEFLPVTAARTTLELGPETLEVVWVPQLTPSRMPLLDQRWTVLPPAAAAVSLIDLGSRFPKRSQAGARWRHTGGRFEAGLSYVDGFNHLPEIEVRPLDPAGRSVAITRVFPRIRSYGVEFAIPTGWISLKGEGSYFTSPEKSFDEYGLYVLEIERQFGEWLVTGGYAGETRDSGLGALGARLDAPALEPGTGDPSGAGAPGLETAAPIRIAFDPERGMARSIIARVAYTVDPRRTISLEAVGRQSGDGFYAKGEYSQAIGDLWRLTFKQIVIMGEDNDFIGQFHRNSHFVIALRLSF